MLLVPTYENASRHYFEKTADRVIEDGYSIHIDDLSENLRQQLPKCLSYIDKPRAAIRYDCILDLCITNSRRIQPKKFNVTVLKNKP